jgi:uncharacterized protein (UPF0303 family)
MDSEMINGTTGGFKSDEIAAIEDTLYLEKFDTADAIEMGKIALLLCQERKLSAAIEVSFTHPSRVLIPITIGGWGARRALLN